MQTDRESKGDDRFCSNCEIEKIPVEVEGTARHGPNTYELRCPECEMTIQGKG